MAQLRTSIATVSLAGTLPEKLRAAAAAGFDAVEVFEPDLLSCPLTPAQVRELAAERGLGISLFQPFRDPDDVDPAAVRRTVHRLHRKCEVARELGTDLLLVCSSVHPGAVREDGRLAEQLRALAEVAAGHGVRLAYEALAWGAHVRDYRHAARVVAAADHPALGNGVDSFHVLSRGDDPADIARIGADKLFFYQVADAPRLPMDVLPLSRHHRCFPGQGGFDLAGFHRAVLASGYSGPVSLEVFNDLFRQSDPAATAVDGMRSLRHLAELTSPDALPAAPRPGGWAFAEVSAAPGPARDVERLLGALGFTRTGVHRRGDVDLWSGGGARIVLNRRRPDVRAQLSSLGLRTPAPHALAERARELLAPLVHRPVGPGEADIPSLVAPDGTWVQFCEDTPTGGWLDDFVAVADERPAARGGAVVEIDHVALPQPFAGFDTASLFLTAVLGLRAHEVAEVAAPDGLVRSRAHTSEDSSIRIALNVGPTAAQLRGRPLASGHVAFRTEDAVGAARAFRRAGGQPLAVPANYYADLEARYGLDRELLATLAELGLLYDRDEHGELLHFFTRSVSREFFVEVLERRGGYRGFGAANTPVRLAAQRRAPGAEAEALPRNG
ncbi:bifunctional sugar phosphate isomerase/epimerase/4-hydroxyphenylpyruvate dioxygenase family protein [Kineococcus sp. SYSU DK006]|uniref:bifunctional sugar phosphate isomerase/epimerase/4-hydroxyphenylpyruvate dioxygenase family protein n=1 Tax=Kineococcus sp. SYSU DK006 TaxID=3383127 RepID=UPI003D7C42B9